LVPLAAGAGLGEPAWEGFYGLVYVAITILVESASLSAAMRVAASLALAAMIPWYLLLGRPVMRLDQQTWDRTAASWPGPVYLTGLIALFAVVLYVNPNAWFLAFAFSPQCFQMTTPMHRSMVFVVAFNGIAALVLAPPQPQLSARETEILVCAARGLTNAEIGRQLFISEATVKTHLLRACGKLGVSGRTAAVAVAAGRGLLKLPGD
jgi:DNA-binding CsgD family transcriptional regulator